MPRSRLLNLTKYVPRCIRNQADHWRDSWKNETEQASNGLSPLKRDDDEEIVLCRR
jgi:hypothetical protein